MIAVNNKSCLKTIRPTNKKRREKKREFVGSCIIKSLGAKWRYWKDPGKA